MTGSRLAAYGLLIKPRIIELLLITTVPAMVLAAGAWPGTGLVAATLFGGFLSAAGANALNNVIDRDIDVHMERTRHRPLPTHRVRPGEAFVIGLALGAAGFLWLWWATNLLAALLATAALAFYVLVYSMFLKRTTHQNIVIGGAAGAVPALVGWAAVTGTLGLPAWVLFGVVFYWTPPHFWALALRFKEDYGRAGVPMLPVVAGVRTTVWQITLYSVVVVAVSLLLYPIASVGSVYLVSALVLGVVLIGQAIALHRRPDRAMRLFRWSNLYLALLFASVVVDVLVAA
ncbi:MAG TPA: heme o synthase [Acidimicrobiia bacterium]|nr:heme o synthase [Acidimicrobiia bacterium]